MKKKLLCLSVISLLSLSACSNTNTDQSSSNQTDEATTTTTETVVSASEITENENQQVKSEFISEAFHILLDYDNENYAERNEEIPNYFTGEALQGLIGAEHLHGDETFKSTSENYKLYQGIGNNTNEFALQIDTTFQVADNEANKLTNIYTFELIEDENSGDYRINNIETTPKQQQSMIP